MFETMQMDIVGMHCSACSTRIEKVVAKMDGVKSISVNLATDKGRVIFDPNQTSKVHILERIKKIGYDASVARNANLTGEYRQKEIRALTLKFVLSALLSIPLIWGMFVHLNWNYIPVPNIFLNSWFQLALATPVQLYIALPFYESAWSAIKNKSANMDVLVVLSTTTAFLYSHYQTFRLSNEYVSLHYETSVLIITFVLLGKLLEAKTKRKTMDAIKKLSNLQVKSATKYSNGIESTTYIHQIVPGDILIVKPGERVPIDGQVVDGHSAVNESMLTGESIPVEKTIGMPVYSGTINENGLLKIQATKKDYETTLAQIISTVEEAQISKPPIQHIADRFTAIFVPIVISLAVITFILWFLLLTPGQVGEAIQKMIAVLIISCPCALGLATPTSIMVGSGRAAGLGILFKEGKFIELLSKKHTVVLDKTGTITKGEPHVTDILVKGYDEKLLLQLIGSIERNTTHPIAKAIVKEVEKQVGSSFPFSNVTVIPGHGVKAVIKNKSVVIANPSFFQKNSYQVSTEVDESTRRLQKQGKTVVLVAIEHHVHAIIAIEDELKKTSKMAISRLKELGLNIVMLSGDNEYSARAIAKKTGIQEVYANVPPHKKAEWIKRKQAKGHHVIMVGDGINDAPALSIANIGIAVGSGSDIAIDAGDITILGGNLNRIADSVLISKKTMLNIKQNFVWAFFYNIISIPLAFLGYLPPWFASAAMAFSSVTVVLNSLRLKRIRL